MSILANKDTRVVIQGGRPASTPPAAWLNFAI